jgi:hypothetical protein
VIATICRALPEAEIVLEVSDAIQGALWRARQSVRQPSPTR